MFDLSPIGNVLWNVLAGGFLETSSRLFIVYLLTALAIACIAFLFSEERKTMSFVSFAMPWRHWSHASHLTDLKLYVFGRLFNGAETLAFAATATATGYAVSVALGSLTGTEQLAEDWSTSRFLVLTVVFALATDFCTYWVHRIHHEWPELWPFHAVHHSAEVMTPFTVYRKHPIYELISSLFRGVVVGAIHGVLLFIFAGNVSIYEIGGANALFVIFDAFGSNLRHSHIWINFGPVLSRIFISPAQHQIHHSIDPKHHNRNYAEVFAFWDWMFGTLYIPRERENLQFGLGDAEGKPLPQAHPDLSAALIKPVHESARAISRRWLRAKSWG